MRCHGLDLIQWALLKHSVFLASSREKVRDSKQNDSIDRGIAGLKVEACGKREVVSKADSSLADSHGGDGISVSL